MSEQGKKKAVAPVLQNMQDYISNHYMDELLDEVCAGIELGIVENLEIDVGNGKVVVDPARSLYSISVSTSLPSLKSRRLLMEIQPDGVGEIEVAVPASREL